MSDDAWVSGVPQGGVQPREWGACSSVPPPTDDDVAAVSRVLRHLQTDPGHLRLPRCAPLRSLLREHAAQHALDMLVPFDVHLNINLTEEMNTDVDSRIANGTDPSIIPLNSVR